MEGKEIFRCDLKRFGSEVRGGGVFSASQMAKSF